MAHLLAVVLLALLPLGRVLVARPVSAIEVDLVPATVFQDDLEVPPAAPDVPLSAQQTASGPDAVEPPPSDGMKAATQLFATRVLSDPKNRDVRQTLPQLDRSERVTQLCVIEGLEQLRRTRTGLAADSISPSAFEPTHWQGLSLDAPGAAYRAAKHWFVLRFACTVAPDLEGVVSYRFATGEAIPRDQWDAHDLIAADEDE